MQNYICKYICKIIYASTYAKLHVNQLREKKTIKLFICILPMKTFFSIFAVNRLKKQISKVFIIKKAEIATLWGKCF